MGAFGYTKEFSSMMDIAGLLNSAQFKVFMDDIVAPYNTNVRDTSGFKALPLKPEYNMTYAALQKENRVGIMANHIALDAHAKPRSTKGFKAMEGTIPSIGANRTWGKEDYLKAAALLHDAQMGGAELVSASQRMLYDMFASPEQGMLAEHANRITYMRDQAVSTGKYSITKANNDGSFTGVEFDFKVPTANKKTLTTTARWWTDDAHATEGTASDPIKDIDDLLLNLFSKNKRKENYMIEIGYLTLHRLIRHSKVTSFIALTINPQVAAADRAGLIVGMSDDQKIAILEAKFGIKFSVRSHIVAIEKFNGKTGVFEDASMNSFEEDVLVLRPKADIGEVHSTRPLSIGQNSENARTASVEGGKILMTYTCDVRERIQIWDSEEITLTVLTAGNDMFYLTVA